MDEAGIFAEPAEARIFCGDALDDRAGVDVGARFERLGNLRAHFGDQRVQFFAEDIVVIVAPGVARNPAARRGAACDGSGCGGGYAACCS